MSDRSSDNAFQEWYRVEAQKTPHVGSKDTWIAALAYAAKLQAERDAEIKKVLDQLDADSFKWHSSVKSDSLEKIRKIMEGKK